MKTKVTHVLPVSTVPYQNHLLFSTVDQLQEWYLDVPLDIQIIFQTFIKKLRHYKSHVIKEILLKANIASPGKDSMIHNCNSGH